MIFQNDIYSASDKRGKISIKKENHIIFRLEIPHGNGTVTPFYVECISEGYINKYLKILNGRVSRFEGEVNMNRKLIEEEIARRKK
jgi:hypothetical protein